MRPLRGIALTLGLATVLAGCGDIWGPADEGTRLERNRRLWSAAKVDDYRMTVKVQGAMFYAAAVVEVRDGVPVSVTPSAPTSLPATHSATAFQALDTVEELFEAVQRAIKQKPARLEVKYDPELGVPVSLYVDVSTTIADEEHGFAVENFQVVR
ncbi:MAG: DUF6174 domain-containing protein [Gemmatimonadota bacterium]|nr:DUF6174 domain-containing protein [Gemmatimonadota bacterium]